MARGARILNELEFYHVMIRGVNREWIFPHEEDKMRIIELIGAKVNKLKVKVYGYCIMDNHMHVLVWADAEHLWKYMHKVNLNYGMYYNYKYNRKGHVFENRYRHENIKDEKHLLATLRYIHRNPVNAGLVETVEEYQWSSIHDYLEQKESVVQRKWREEMIANYFGIIDGFIQFHQQFDHELYLEIEEQREKEVSYWVEQKMLEIMRLHQLNRFTEIAEDVVARENLIEALRVEGNLTMREIAMRLNISEKTVARVVKKQRNIS